MYPGGSARQKAASLRIEAASLREQAELRLREAENWDSGADGEARVARELSRLDPHAWATLHDRLVRPDESKANLDHLVAGPGGVFLIDSKNWSSGVWVYDGMLFHRGQGQALSCRNDLTHIARDAAVVRERIGHPVTPILCLSTAKTAKIDRPTEIDGVHVVPIGRLSGFLRSHTPTLEPTDVQQLIRRIEAAFPPAYEGPPPANIRPAIDIRSSSPSVIRRSVRARRRSRSQRGRPIAAIIGMLVLVALLPHLGRAFSHAFTTLVTPSATPAANPFAAPCSFVTDADVAASVGRQVMRVAASPTDTCKWTYQAGTPTFMPDVEITTGWLMNTEAQAAHGAVQKPHDTRLERVVVPQSVAVPGSPLPASRTTQPLGVSVAVGSGVTRARAQQAVLVLARLTETHMPTGKGATDVRPYR